MTHNLTRYCYRFVRLLPGLALLAGFLAWPAAAAARQTDQIIVKAKPGRNLAAVHARGKGKLKKKIRFESGELNVLQLPAGVSVEEALAHYRVAGDVEFAEPDYILTANGIPNDPHYADGTLWAHYNYGQSGGVNDADIDAPEAWNVNSSAPDIIVAVIDSGVRYTHEDLAANMWRNPTEVPGNGLDDDRNGYIDDVHGFNAVNGTGNPMDDNGHGTHVAGTIAAAGNNGRGVVGVAWGAQVMALKFLDRNGQGYTSDAIEAVDYARVKGASVINASFAGPGYSVAFRDVILRARSAGVVIVAAAGNELANNDVVPSYPASFQIDNVVTVAASTRNDTLAIDYSNFGAQSVHLAAPGSSIYSTYHAGDNSYGWMSGTSMAAPHVAGALALVRAHYRAESYRQAIDRILKGVDVLPALAGKCSTGGRLNLDKALKGIAATDSRAVKLAMMSARPGEVQVRITGAPGQNCFLEQSSDLTQWRTLGRVVLPLNGPATVTVNVGTNQVGYFRARSS